MGRRPTKIWLKIPLLIVLLATIWVWQRITVVKMIRSNSYLCDQVEMKRETADKLAAAISQLRQRERITATVEATLQLEPASPAQVHALIPQAPEPTATSGSGWQRFDNAVGKLAEISSLGGDR